MAQSIDKELTPVNVGLSGKLITCVDPANIGINNFRSLINLRPGPTNPEPIQGMSKVNTVALANPNFSCGIQFMKDDPVAESHVVVHAKDASNTNGKVYRNTTAIPSQGNFETTALFSDSAGAGTPRFSLAPLGMLVYCNGTDSVIWPGLESVCAGFIDYHPDKTYRYNYTRQVTNDLTDSNNLATVHRRSETADANTMLLLHLDADLTDSSPTTPHTVTANGNAAVSATQKKFGAGSCVFDGTGDYLSIPDDADFDFSGGVWTVDCWIRHTSGATGTWDIFEHATDADNYINISTTAGLVSGVYRAKFTLTIKATAVVVSLETAQIYSSAGNWWHLAVVENGDNYYIFVNGSLAASVSDTDRPANYTGAACIGGNGVNSDFNGYIDEFRVSDSARWTAAFEAPTQAYEQGNISSFYVGSALPLQGINWYVQTANTAAGAAVVYYWDGSSWVSVGTLTGVGATPFSATGKNSWTFTSTASTAKPKIIDGAMAYWYKVEITEVDTTTQFYQVTLACAMQSIRDLWDGAYMKISSFQKYQAGAFNDLTTGVFDTGWDSSNTATFAEVDSLPTATGYLYCGFVDRQQGLRFAIIGGHVNTTAGTSMTVEYWNGTAWITVGVLDDGTMEGGISFSKAGVVTWNSPELASEFETDLPGASRPALAPTDLAAWGDRLRRVVSKTGAKTVDRPPLYYYRVSFSQTLSADVQLDFIGGIPAQRVLKSYDFSFMHLDRLWLVRGNKILASSQGTAQVFNGEDVLEFQVGHGTDVVGAASLTTRVGNSIYAVLLLYKEGELWTLVGSDPETMIGPLKIADIGLTAVKTLAIIPSYEIGPGLSRPIAVWQSSDGIYMSDGFSVNPIHGDIADRFDDRKSTCINRSYVSSSFGAYDEKFNEYHWSCAEGAAVSPDKEWAYRFTGGKWFEIDRTSAKRLTAMIPVKDASGNSYMYATIAGGYMERLENGPTFDSVNITYTMWPADIAPAEGNLAIETELRGIKLVCKANNDTANTIAVTHYVDGDTTGRAVTAMAPQKASRRIASVFRSVSFDGVTHSTKFVLSSDLGAVGFEPLFLSYYIKPKRLDKGLSTGTPVS